MSASLHPGLGLGFADLVHHSGQAFRSLLTAMARPGEIQPLDFPVEPPSPLFRAMAATVLTLADLDTSLWLDQDAAKPDVAEYFRFHCGCPITHDPSRSDFAVVARGHALPALDRFSLGSELRPERSTTLLVQVAALDGGPVKILSGPGIDGTTRFAPQGLDPALWSMRHELAPLYPQGIDLILVAEDRVACLPRTTIVQEENA